MMLLLSLIVLIVFVFIANFAHSNGISLPTIT